jgi:transposase
MSQEKAKPPEYGAEMKLTAVRRVLAGESVGAVAQELGIRRKRLYVWKDRYAELGEAGLARRRGGRPRKPAGVAVNGSEGRAGRESCWQRGGGSQSWNAKWGSRNWNWIFSAKPCGA